MDQLKFAIIHSLDKEANSNVATMRLAQTTLDVSSATVVSLAEQLSKLVGKDGSSVFWGQFGNDNRQGKFPGAVKPLAEEETLDAFVTASHEAMSELQRKAKDENFATGGYVCFLVYVSQGSTFLLVAMIKERGALTLTADLVPTEIKEIDLSKLHQAARVNLDRYAQALQASEPADEAPPAEDDGEALEKTYLCFINRKSQKADVASYFVEALGCEKGVSSGRTTKALIHAVRAFVRTNSETKDLAKAVRRAVIDYLHAQPDGATIALTSVVNVVRHALGPELARCAEGLAEYLQGDDIQIPAEFSVSASALDAMTRIRATTALWNLSFDDAALGLQDSEIVYNPETHTLLFTKLPEDTVRRVEAALAERRLESAFTEVTS